MRLCTAPGCSEHHYARGLCSGHYQHHWRVGDLACFERKYPEVDSYPLVCVCPEPKADPHRNAGMCDTCKRKPLALMAART